MGEGAVMAEEPKFRRGRKVRQVSCRPLKLTDDAQADVEEWLKLPKTLAQKAAQLGISRQTLSAYIHKKHKPRKEVDLDALTEEVSLRIGQVPQKTQVGECTQQNQS